jgi:small subunit ribosomal protein S2
MTSGVKFTMRQLLEAGVHFGHVTRRWNPKMKPFIYGVRNGVHVINLEKTVPCLRNALNLIEDTVAEGGRVLFVGTKPQAADIIAETAKRCAQHYVNHRWLGGMLTNWNTISQSLKRLKALDAQFEKEVAGEDLGLTKKERLSMDRERQKLDMALGGIRNMGGLPDVVVVIDTNREKTAIREARILKIPVVAIMDTNSDPDGIDYPVPGNDDANRAIMLYCELFGTAVLNGIQREMSRSGGDMGAKANPKPEKIIEKEEDSVSSEEVPDVAVVVEKKSARKVPVKVDEKAPEPVEEKTEEKTATPKKAPAKKADVKKADAPKKAPAKKAPAKKGE